MPGYTSIKKGACTDRQGRASSQRSEARLSSQTEGGEDVSTDEREATTDKLSSALKSLLTYRKKNTALKMVPKYQGAGDEYEEVFNGSMYQSGVPSDVLARGLDEFDSEDRQLFLEALSYAIDILNIAICQLRKAEPGGRVEQHLSKVFAVEEEGLNDILDFSGMAKLLEENYSILRDALIDFGGKRRNQILYSSNMEVSASVELDDPHRRLHVGLGFFEDEVTYQRALILIHEISHQELGTRDYWYNFAFKSKEQYSRYYRELKFLERSIDLQRQIVSGLSVKDLEEKEEFAKDLGLDSPGGEPDYERAIYLFHNDFVERMDAYINNADSIACLAPIIAGPDLVSLSNRGIYKK